jgi:hypothetical protein
MKHYLSEGPVNNPEFLPLQAYNVLFTEASGKTGNRYLEVLTYGETR